LGPGIDTSASDPLSIDDDLTLAEWQPPDDATPVLRVTAVLVAHDGVHFLPRTLDALDAQTRPPDHLIAVDAGSLDGGGDLLALATGQLLRLNRDTSFGDAVQAALTALDGHSLQPAADPRPARDPRIGAALRRLPSARRPAGVLPAARVPGLDPPPAEAPGVEWLWLLHDDSAPAPDALERLIEAVDGGPSIGIAGCKQVSWDDSRRLLDVGFTTSRLGARVTGVDVDDVDQGQLDHRSDVMAVGTAGMLVRRDVWDRLGGPDPALAHARDDLDLCRRAHLAGLRVVVVPRAVIAHAQATASGRRGAGASTSGSASASWALRDRRAAIHLRLASVPLLALPLLILWLAAAAGLRALVRLGLKQPDRAGAELAAYGLVLARPMSWLRARRRVRAGRQLPRRDYRRLLAGPGAALRQRRDALSSYLRSQEQAAALAEAAAAAAISAPVSASAGADPVLAGGSATPERHAVVEEEDDPFDDERPRSGRRPDARIGVFLALALGLAGLAGLRLLLSGSGVPLGPALIPAPAHAGGLWTLARSGWRPSGLGFAAAADPFDAVLAVIAWPLAGSTRVAAELLLLGALPLAAGLAWWAAGGITRSRALRAWAALGWAAAPALLTAVSTGRLDAIVAHLALPPAALALARAIGARPVDPARPLPRASLSGASWAGLLLTVVIAASPALAVPALLALLVAAAVSRVGRRRLIWTALVPAVLLLPWWLAVAREPRLLLAEPGGPSDLGTTGSNGWAAALWPGDPAVLQRGPAHGLANIMANLTALGDASVWLRGAAITVAGPLLVLALLALRRGPRRRAAGALWLIGLAGLLVAVLIPVLTARADAGGTRYGWAGPGISLLTLAALAAALVRLDGAAGRLRSRNLGLRHWLAVEVGIVAVLAPVLMLTAWTTAGWTGGPARWVHRGSPDVLPAVATAEAEGPAATRTLVLKLVDGQIHWALYRAGGPRIGQESAASPVSLKAGSDDPLLAAIGGLLTDSATDQRDRLADLDIGSVLLLGPVDDPTTLALDTAPGLVRVARPSGAVLWRVELGGSGSGAEADDASTRPARVRLISASGEVLGTLPSHGLDVRTTLPSGPAGRKLVLAERADPGWQAWLGGHRLTATTQAGWAQAFTLPAAGGRVTVQYVTARQRPIDLTQLGVLALALLMAVPLPRRRLRLRPIPRSERPAGPPVPARRTGRRIRLKPESLAAVQFAEPESFAPESFAVDPDAEPDVGRDDGPDDGPAVDPTGTSDERDDRDGREDREQPEERHALAEPDLEPDVEPIAESVGRPQPLIPPIWGVVSEPETEDDAEDPAEPLPAHNVFNHEIPTEDGEPSPDERFLPIPPTPADEEDR
jgi:GT2 family glycosyltransferase